MDKHTKGDWIFSPKDGTVHLEDGAGPQVFPLICTVEHEGTSQEQFEADGRLIAAAPAILKALRDLMQEVKSTSAWIDAKNGEDDGLLATMRAAEEAVDQAERAEVAPCPDCNGLGAFPDTGMDCARCYGGGTISIKGAGFDAYEKTEDATRISTIAADAIAKAEGRTDGR